jgi:hypothetical protein
VSEVGTKFVQPLRYLALEREVSLAELDDFLAEAIAALNVGEGAGAEPPFAIFHGQVNERTRSRVEVGVPAQSGDRTLPGGLVVYGHSEGATDYVSIHRLYDEIAAYIETNDLHQNGPTREVYRSREPQAEQIEVVWPVEG